MHSFGDLKEDPGVAGDHDDQRQQEKAGEGEHVVGGFVPARQETPAGGALGEVLRKDDGHTVKDEYLQEGRPLHKYHSNCGDEVDSRARVPYLRDGEHEAHDPRHGQHDFIPLSGLINSQRVENGRLSIQAYHHGDEGTGVHGLQLEKHQHSAGKVPSDPLHGDVPHGVHRHHDEGDQQVGECQVDDQHPDVGLPPPFAVCHPQDGQVAEGRDDAEDPGDGHPDFGRGGEGGQQRGAVHRRPVGPGPGIVDAGIQVALWRRVKHGCWHRVTQRGIHLPMAEKEHILLIHHEDGSRVGAERGNISKTQSR